MDIESPRPFRVLVTGARRITRPQIDTVTSVLSRTTAAARKDGQLVVIIEGECPHDRLHCLGGEFCYHQSVDLAARFWVDATAGATLEPYPGDWAAEGKAAGAMRNQRMVDAGADICLAFPVDNSIGTWDCLKRAAKAGIIGRVYPLGAAP